MAKFNLDEITVKVALKPRLVMLPYVMMYLIIIQDTLLD